MIEEIYKGIRPAPGYPACPDHLENLRLEITKCRKGDRSNLDGEHGDVALRLYLDIILKSRK
jgi:hypothetical protein